MLPSQVTENKILNSRITKNKNSPIMNHMKTPPPPHLKYSFHVFQQLYLFCFLVFNVCVNRSHNQMQFHFFKFFYIH